MLHFLFVLFGLLLYYVISFYKKVSRYPKGPTPLPFIGNALQVDYRKAHEIFPELSKKYGNVFTVWLPRPIVVLGDYSTTKEAFSGSDDFAGRSGAFPDTVYQTVENGGIIFSQGESWKEQRRFSLQVLRDFGMGKSLMENMVVDSLQDCINLLKTLEPAKGIDIRWPIQLFVTNIITKILFNFSFKYNDCQLLKDFVYAQNEEMDNKKKTPPLTLFFAQNHPWVLKLPILGNFLVGHHFDVVNKQHVRIKNFIKTSLKSYDPNQEPECFVHAYMKKLGSSEHFTEEQMINSCFDFYLAGQETTTTTLRWSMLFLAKYQPVQEKLRQEIMSIIGPDRLVSMNDKARMPYAQATVNEIQRYADLVPLNVPHRTVKNTQAGGKSIPEDTIVISLLTNVLHDSFKNGDEFNPDRFILPDGSLNKEALEKLIPFSIGKRVCAGEGLARVELFIGVVSLVQHYKILPMPGEEVDLTPYISVVKLPKNQKLRLIPLQ